MAPPAIMSAYGPMLHLCTDLLAQASTAAADAVLLGMAEPHSRTMSPLPPGQWAVLPSWLGLIDCKSILPWKTVKA